MNIDDLFDDDLLDTPRVDLSNPENVFPIIGCKCNEPFSLGTGFFINQNGYFITAGHVLSNKSRRYFALVNDEKYEFEIVFIEYVDVLKQFPPICRDLVICKITGLETKQIDYTFACDSSEDKKVLYSGYQNKNTPNRIDSVKVFEWSEVYLYKLNDNDIKLKGAKPKITIYDTSYDDNRHICDNIKSLTAERIVHGMSGGPVYYENEVYGMLIGDCYILSEYIVKKLKELNINYK